MSYQTLFISLPHSFQDLVLKNVSVHIILLLWKILGDFFPFQYFLVTLSNHFCCLPPRPSSPVKQFSSRDELKNQADFHGGFKYFLKFYLRETHISRKNINNCSFPSSLKMAKTMGKAIACISSGLGQVSESPPCSHKEDSHEAMRPLFFSAAGFVSDLRFFKSPIQFWLFLYHFEKKKSLKNISKIYSNVVGFFFF